LAGCTHFAGKFVMSTVHKNTSSSEGSAGRGADTTDKGNGITEKAWLLSAKMATDIYIYIYIYI